MFGFTGDHYSAFANEAETAFAEYLESKHIQGSELTRLTNEFNIGFREGWVTDYGRLESRIQSSLSSDILSQFGALKLGRALGVLAATLRNSGHPAMNDQRCQNSLKKFVLELRNHHPNMLKIVKKAVKESEEYLGKHGVKNLSDQKAGAQYRFIAELLKIAE